jgi:hypothetical protein
MRVHLLIGICGRFKQGQLGMARIKTGLLKHGVYVKQSLRACSIDRESKQLLF